MEVVMGRTGMPILRQLRGNVCGSSLVVRRRMMASVAEDGSGRGESVVRQQLESAAREDRLDFFTAAKILFSTPSKPRTFGLDFHLWQFFAACLPPFAVYLTAQYARCEIRRMEEERQAAEKMALQAVVAEELDLRLADNGNKSIERSGDSKEESTSPSVQAKQKVEANLRKDGVVVLVPEKDIQAMQTRLDQLEHKLKLLESVRSGDNPEAIPITKIRRDATSTLPPPEARIITKSAVSS